MADIFFSYSRRDRERVGLVRNALAEMGFEVFWDQETPSGSDWDTWIRGELAKSKCAVVFWSETSIVSDNVRHEAVVAKEQRKLISVFLDQLPARDLPMGFYSQQAADLSKWDGDQEDAEWRKFRGEFEAKLMPRWVQQKLNRVDAELEGERARRESAEAHEKALRAQISKEAKKQQDLKRERDGALAEMGELRAAVEERDKALQEQVAQQVGTEQVLKNQRESALAEVTKFETMLQERDATLKELTAKQADTEQGLRTERDLALAEVAELKTTIEGLTQAQPELRSAMEPRKRWLSPIAVGMLLLAAVLGATVSFLFSSRRVDPPVEANAALTTAALAKSEQARQATEAEAARSDKARQAAVSRADEADKARQAAEKARQAAEAKAAQAIAALPGDTCQTAEAKATTTATSPTLRRNMKVRGAASGYYAADFAGDCEQKCARDDSCKAYTYGRKAQECYLYTSFLDFVPSDNFDSNIRESGVLFTPIRGMGIRGVECNAYASIVSVGDCEQMCARSYGSCKAFTYSKQKRACYLYTSFADFVLNENYDSGIIAK